jgi:uncharacterized protein (DUF2236 family)
VTEGRDPTLPTPEQVHDLVAKPDSMVWRLANDMRGFSVAGYALLIQVANPNVSMGVEEHSQFESDPWGRLINTVDFVNMITFGTTDEARDIGRVIRHRHRTIKRRGVYHALEPKTYSWVWGSLGYAMVTGHEQFVAGLSGDEKQQFWTEWRDLGRLLGVRDRDLPAKWSDYEIEVARIFRDELQRTPTADKVLKLLASPTLPNQFPDFVRPVWKAMMLVSGQAATVLTVGLLPPVLREKFGLKWPETSKRQFAVLGFALRHSPVGRVPFGQIWMAKRRQAIHRKYFAAQPGRPPAAANSLS